MKKIFTSTILMLALIVSILPISNKEAKAADLKLPFVLSAPVRTGVAPTESDAINCMTVSYSKTEAMSGYLSLENEEKRAKIEALGYEDVWVNGQVDWSIDSQNDWHANNYWLTDGYDGNGNNMLGEWAYYATDASPDINDSLWIFRYMGDMNAEDSRWYEDGHGWASVLKPDQYETVDVDGEKLAKIDWTKHTLYVRTRYVVTVRHDVNGESVDDKVVSDWSPVAGYGKDVAAKGPLTSADVAAPVVSNLILSSEMYNNRPTFKFNVTVPDTLKEQEADVAAKSGYIYMEADVRFSPSGEWKQVQLDNRDITAGLHTAYVGSVAEDMNITGNTYVEMRVRYYCVQYTSYGGEYLGEFYSPYSNVMKVGNIAFAPGSSQIYTSGQIAAAQKNGWKDADASMADQAIINLKNDNDIKGASFGKLRAKVAKYNGNSNTISWTKAAGANGYLIYGNRCGKANKYQYIADAGNSAKYVHKNLSKGAYYKYIVVAYKNVNGVKKVVAISKTIHSTTTGGKKGNAKKVQVNISKVTLKAKKSIKITAKEIKKDKPIDKHRKISFESSDEKVAVVNSKGVIKAKSKGKCVVYAFAQNGIYATIKVTVK